MKSIVKLFCFVLLLLFFYPGLKAQPKLWGTLPFGGEPESGLIYQFNLSNDQWTEVYAFKAFKGANSRREVLLADNNKLYGIASGGFDQFGTFIYEYDPAAGAYNVVHDFYDPVVQFSYAAGQGSLMQASDGLIYGVSQNGGATMAGQLFSIDPSSGAYNVLIDFENTATTGGYPVGRLVEANDGKLYGVTAEGGSCNFGTIYSFDPGTNNLEVVKCFDYTNGADPYDGMIKASNGILYGMTYSGGGSDDGVIYSLEPGTNIYTLLHEFSTAAHGGKPAGRLFQASDGALYGMASEGGLNGAGILFKYDIDLDLFVLRINFDGSNGQSPNGSLIEYGGYIYGMSTEGGVANEGLLFRYDFTSNEIVKLVDFYGEDYGRYPYGSLTIGPEGSLIGQTYAGGKNNFGIMFDYNTSANIFTKHFDFGEASEGAYCYSPLIIGSDGWIYGSCAGGGMYNGGTIYRINPVDREFEHLYDFDIYTYGSSPTYGLIEAEDGYFYGTTTYGGSVNYGVIFRFDANNKIVTILEDMFTETEGRHPSGAPMQASDGFLYGLTSRGGSIGDGALYKFNLSNGVYSKQADFQGAATGSIPQGSLVEAGNGKLYALAPSGGQFAFGTLFEYNPVLATLYVAVHFDGINKGATPTGTLLKYDDHKFYGLCTEGGLNDAGTLFEYDTESGSCTKLLDFNTTSTGHEPLSSLMKASNGKIYGTTKRGGDYNSGVLFEYDPSTSEYSIIHSFTSFREYPMYSALLEVETNYGINDPVDQSCTMLIYPNPARNTLYIEAKHGQGAEVCIMNQQGQTVSQSTLQAQNNMINLDIDKLEAGTYFIRVKNQQSIACGKFIKTD